MSEPITIVGGGLAGLALGIELRKRGIPTTLCEAGHYPRHKVCGEFISGKGQEVLLKLEPSIVTETRPAKTVAFFNNRTGSRPHPLPRPGWAISRHKLDSLLSASFRNRGGDLQTGTQWKQPYAASVVRATGRRPKPVDGGWRWFGLKSHAHNVSLSADLEMHLIPNGYVGLCRLSDSEVNVCGLFRNKPGNADRQPKQDFLRGPADSVLNRRLANSAFDPESFCSVAGLNLSPEVRGSNGQFSIGDALTMTPPVTGNGMSIALESAALAAPTIEEFYQGRLTWPQALVKMGRESRQRFGFRLRRAEILHKMLFTKFLRNITIPIITKSSLATAVLFRTTR